MNSKFIVLKFTKAIKDCVVRRCVAPSILALNDHGNPCMLNQFSNHRKSLCEIAHVRVEKSGCDGDMKNITIGSRWKSGISHTILNIFRPYNEIDVLKLPFLEELYERTFVVPYVDIALEICKWKIFSD